MIILQMIIINLTVAAVIDGLASARKDINGIIKRDEVDDLITLWSEYDPTATGYIEVSDLVFLLFELPKPMGYGKDRNLIYKDKTSAKGAAEKEIKDILRETFKTRQRLQEIVRLGNNVDYDSSMSAYDVRHPTKIKRNKTFRGGNSLNLLINSERNIVLKKFEAIKILEHFDIPYYENRKVHFRDIWKTVVDNTFENDNQKIEVGPRLTKRIKRGWEKKYKLGKQKKINIAIQKIMAATVVLKWIRYHRGRKEDRGEQVNESVRNVEDKVEDILMMSIDEGKDDDQISIARSIVASIFGKRSSVDHRFEEEKEVPVESNIV
jgi:hypothetical protein